jgi:hypothetical protein
MHKLLTVILLLTTVSCAAVRPSEPLANQTREAPRYRISSYATDTFGTRFTSAMESGRHSYEGGRDENNGIIYACRGGHIDLAHLRKAADWTAFLAERAYLQLLEGQTSFTFKFYEPSIYHVQVSYPTDWHTLSTNEKQRIANDVAIHAGQYFSHVGLTWHEILTWYDYRITRIYPHFPSAFSWEDTYSNTLGIYLAGLALRDEERGFDDGMTYSIQQEVDTLGPQPASVSEQASVSMRGDWYDGKLWFMVEMRARNLDIGLDDGVVSPWLIPTVRQCSDATPKDYPVPAETSLSQQGFDIKLEIDPRVPQNDELFEAIYPEGEPDNARIEPRQHFPAIMAQIRRQAEQLYGAGMLEAPAR